MPRIFVVLAVVTCAIFGTLFYQYYAQQQQAAQLEAYQRVLHRKTEHIFQQAQDWSQPIQIDMTSPELSGDYAVMAQFILQQIVQNAEARNQYLRDLKAQNWDRFLDVPRLAKDQKQDYAETIAMLSAVDKIVKDYELSSEQRATSMIEAAKKLEIKNRYRQQLITNLRADLDNEDANAIFEIEKQSLAKAHQIFALLQKYKWQNKDNQVMFHDDAPIQPFNTLYKDMLELNRQMEQVKSHHQQQVEQQL